MKYVPITAYWIVNNEEYSHRSISGNEVNQIEMRGDEMGSSAQWLTANIVGDRRKK